MFFRAFSYVRTFDKIGFPPYNEAIKTKEGFTMSKNLTYHRDGDYLLPNVVPPDEPHIGI